MINIGKVIYSKIQHLVSGKVYPLIAEQTTTFPYVVYRRTVSLPQDTKDAFVFKLKNTVEIKVVTKEYDEGVRLVSLIFDIFDNFHGNVGGIEVVETKIASLSEQYVQNSYVQTLTITISTN